MRSEYATADILRLLSRRMQPDNALCLEVCLQTGLRIGDVLALTPGQLEGRTISCIEAKTGKAAKKTVTARTAAELRRNSDGEALFPSRRAGTVHKSRQAVYIDMRKAAEIYGIKQHVSPHSARKNYGVEMYRQGGLTAAQRALHHDRPETTLLYALSDKMSKTEPDGAEAERIAEIIAEKLKPFVTEWLKEAGDLCKVHKK